MNKALIMGLAFSALGINSVWAGDYVPAKGVPVEGEYIVVFEDNFVGNDNFDGRVSVAHDFAQNFNGQVEGVFQSALNGAVMTMSEADAKMLATQQGVRLVEQNQVVRADVVQTPATWGLDRTDQRSLPLNNTYNYNFDGTGVHAYILDTGIRSTHVEFGNRVSSQFFDAFSGTGEDCNGHGTHVAGTVGGSTYGVAKDVTLYKVRVLDCAGSGSIAGVVAGVDWVKVNHISPAVANMSLGGSASPSLDSAVNSAVAAGVVFAVAAGNSNLDACGHSPAAAVSAITVASSTSSDSRSSFSNWGSCVDIFAPGSSITSTWHTTNTATNTISGTSMASPHVAGVAALIRDENPSLTAAQVAAKMNTMATAGVVVDVRGSPNRLLYSLTAGTPPPPPPGNQPPVASFSHTVSGLTVSFIDTSSDIDGVVAAWSWNFGDGTASVAQSPSHTYSVGGSFTVSLTVTDNLGATNTVSKVITVTGPTPPPPPPPPGGCQGNCSD